jgi:hypothetical protein
MNEGFVRTGVFATEQECEHIKTMANMPYIVAGGTVPESPQVVVHRIARLHDLPEIAGYYGIDLQNGEFIHA